MLVPFVLLRVISRIVSLWLRQSLLRKLSSLILTLAEGNVYGTSKNVEARVCSPLHTRAPPRPLTTKMASDQTELN